MLPMFHVRVCKPTTWAFLTAYLSIHPHANSFHHLNSYYIFGQPFVKWFALCYQTAVCLSVMLVYCGQMVGWNNMKLGMEAGLSPGHIVLDGDPVPLPKRGTAPQFSAHVCCGQTAGWIKMALGTKVDLCPRDVVLDGDTTPPQKGGNSIPHFSAHIYCGEMVVHLSYCWAFVMFGVWNHIFLHQLVAKVQQLTIRYSD